MKPHSVVASQATSIREDPSPRPSPRGRGSQRTLKYLAVARTTSQASLVYNRDLLLRTVFMLVVITVFVQLWGATFGTTGRSSVNGFAMHDLIWYMVVTEALVLSVPRIVQTIDAEVRGGDVAYR